MQTERVDFPLASLPAYRVDKSRASSSLVGGCSSSLKRDAFSPSFLQSGTCQQHSQGRFLIGRYFLNVDAGHEAASNARCKPSTIAMSMITIHVHWTTTDISAMTPISRVFLPSIRKRTQITPTETALSTAKHVLSFYPMPSNTDNGTKYTKFQQAPDYRKKQSDHARLLRRIRSAHTRKTRRQEDRFVLLYQRNLEPPRTH